MKLISSKRRVDTKYEIKISTYIFQCSIEKMISVLFKKLHREIVQIR